MRTNPRHREGRADHRKIALGGQLSACSCVALKVALADRGSASDPGLRRDRHRRRRCGGRCDRPAAGAPFRRVQVLSVTHAPQVAQGPSRINLISKSGGSDSVSTGIRSLEIASAARGDRANAGGRDHPPEAAHAAAAAPGKHGSRLTVCGGHGGNRLRFYIRIGIEKECSAATRRF